MGLGGRERQMEIYREMVGEEVAALGGRPIEPEPGLRLDFDEFTNGCSQKVLRMFAPYSGYAAVIGCLPLVKAVEIHETIKATVARHGVKDVHTGDPLTPELIIIPYDRGATAYVEHEILFDPLRPGVRQTRQLLPAGLLSGNRHQPRRRAYHAQSQLDENHEPRVRGSTDRI